MSCHTAPSIAALTAQHLHRHLPQKGHREGGRCSSAHRYVLFQRGPYSQHINSWISPRIPFVWYRLEEFVS